MRVDTLLSKRTKQKGTEMIYNKNTSTKVLRFGKFEAIRYVIGTESIHIVSTDYKVIYRNILSR